MMNPAHLMSRQFLGALLALFTIPSSLSIVYAAAPAASPDLDPVGRDLPAIKALLPENTELAGAYARDLDSGGDAAKISVKKDRDYLLAVSHSYVKADFNNDGREDLAVVVEQPPQTNPDKSMDFGDRTLLIFIADETGKLVRFEESTTAVMRADDGGTFGDPFDGLSVNSKKTLSVSHFGGASDRWGFTQRFQFRSGDFYLIGTTSLGMNSVTGKGTTVDTNLLTGDQVETRTNGDRPSTATKRKVATQALKKLTETPPPS